MNKDRGMIKWMPFNSVVSNKEILYSLIKEKEKITKPHISEDETNGRNYYYEEQFFRKL